MTILVTGGAGYIGSHTVKALKKAGHKVVVFDSLEHGYRESLPGFTENQDLYIGNILDKSDLEEAFQSTYFDAVIHFAAYIEAGESVKEPGKFFWNNTAGTINLLNAMSRWEVNNLVFSSTAAVYGQPKQVPIPEAAEKKPTNPYGTSKLLVEQTLRDLTQLTPLKATILRYFNACGADPEGDLGEKHRPETHLIPLVLQVALGQREEIKIFGTDYPTPDGTAIRDYVHVTDLAKAHIHAVEETTSSEKLATYNVGTGEGYSVKEVIEMCRKITGHPIPAREEARREGDPAELVADPGKISRALNWHPELSDLATIIETAWRWHKKQGKAHHEETV